MKREFQRNSTLSTNELGGFLVLLHDFLITAQDFYNNEKITLT